MLAIELYDGVARADEPMAWRPPTGQPHFRPRAKNVIWIFLVGGMSQMESFDPKPMLTKYAGKTIAENLADAPDAPPAGQDVVRPMDAPVYAQGHLAILRGNLAPEGSVAKISGLKLPRITGPARVFDSEEAAFAAIRAMNSSCGLPFRCAKALRWIWPSCLSKRVGPEMRGH